MRISFLVRMANCVCISLAVVYKTNSSYVCSPTEIGCKFPEVHYSQSSYGLLCVELKERIYTLSFLIVDRH